MVFRVSVHISKLLYCKRWYFLWFYIWLRKISINLIMDNFDAWSDDFRDEYEWVYQEITLFRMQSIYNVSQKKHSPKYIRRLYQMEIFIEAMNDVCYHSGIIYLQTQVLNVVKTNSRYSNFISVFSTILSKHLKHSNVSLNEIAG